MRNFLMRYRFIIIGLLGSCFLIMLLAQFFFHTSIISISLGATSFEPGSSITMTIDKKNIPSDAGVVLYLIRNTKNNPKGLDIGPLMLKPQKINGTGREEFVWNGKETGCAPVDLPMWCHDRIEAGSYSIRAIVFNRSDFSILGRPSKSERKVIAKYTTKPFYIKGSIDLTPLQSRLKAAPKQYLIEQEKLFDPFLSVKEIEKFFSQEGQIKKLDGGIFCLDSILLDPFSGTLSTCTNKSVLSDDEGLVFDPYHDIEVTGTIGYSSKLTYQQATEMAKSTADEYFGSITGHGGDNGGEFSAGGTIKKWVYRQDGKYWLFIVSSNYSTDIALIRLDNTTDTYCIVDIVPYQTESTLNISSGTHECKK